MWKKMVQREGSPDFKFKTNNAKTLTVKPKPQRAGR